MTAWAIVALSSAQAIAQQTQCYDNRTRGIDAQGTVTWQRLLQTNDPAAMRMLVGTWFNQNTNRQLNMTQSIYQTFDPNGLFQYRDQTCGGMVNTCSNNYGTGSFRASRQQDGSIFFMTNFSDLNRTNQCVSGQVTFPNQTTMVSRTGAVWRRVP